MRTKKRPLLRLEPMESKALMSALGTAPTASIASVSAVNAGHPLRLLGVINGHYSSPITIPDAGTRYDLAGAGLVRPLGHSTIVGGVNAVGLIRGGHAGGTITLTQARGTVTLSVTAPAQDGPAKLPFQFRFTIEGGTGAFQGAKGSGTALLVFDTGIGRSGVGTYDLTLLGDLTKAH